MKLAFAAFCYFAALVLIYTGFAMPGAEALNHGFPSNDGELFAALLISAGMAAKLLGHVFLLSSARA